MKDMYIFGIHPIMEALVAGKKIDKVFIQQNLQGENYKKLLAELRAHKIRIQYVPIEKLNKLTSQNHQGVVASVAQIQFYRLEDLIMESFAHEKIPFFLLLDRITDVRNFGAIIRTAECVGVDGIIIPEKDSAAINSDTVKASAGALYHMKICKESNLAKSVQFLQSSGIKIVAATEKAENTIYSENLLTPLALLMGSEDKGIHPALLKLADVTAKLPIVGLTQSLNVSVAAGALMYEVVRQRLI